MNDSLIVTHCLALLSEYTGRMTQADKDFFDSRVETAVNQADDLFVAVLLLLSMRLSMDLPEQDAESIAKDLTAHHAERWGSAIKVA